MPSIQMQISKKQKAFFQVFPAFLEFRLCFERFEKKDDPRIGYVFRNKRMRKW